MQTTCPALPQRRIRWHSEEEDADVQRSPSDDDGGEDQLKAMRVQPVTQMKPCCSKTEGLRRPSAYRYDRLASKEHRRQQRVGQQLSPYNDANDLFVTTMDEDDQQLFIALYFWRRKVLHAQFSAWKWVAFTMRQSTKELRRNRIKVDETHSRKQKSLSDREFNNLRSVRPNLILKRSTRSADEFDKCVGMRKQTPSYGDYGGYRKPNNNSLSLPAKADINASEKRRQFRADLRLIYSCFDQWKSHMDTLKQRRMEKLEVVAEFCRLHQLKKIFHGWRHWSRLRKHKTKRCHIADRFYLDRTQRKHFDKWRRFYRVEREIIRRHALRSTRLKQSVLHNWCKQILKMRRCRELCDKQIRKQLWITFNCFCYGVQLTRDAHQRRLAATSHYEHSLLRSVIRRWDTSVFRSPQYIQSTEYKKHIIASSGVRRWRRLVAMRTQQTQENLLADCFRYQARLRRGIDGWKQYLHYRRQRKQVKDEARDHHVRNLKVLVIRRLQAAGKNQKERRRHVRMAVRWYQRSLQTKIFELWILNAKHCTRVRDFQCAMYERKLSGSVHAWRRHAAASTTLSAKQRQISKRWSELTLKTYTSKWVRLMHVRNFVSSITLKHRNISTARHFQAWKDWKIQRLLHCNIVVQHRLHSDATLVQRVISHWVDLTLRRRCLQRLIKLFRKKQARNHLGAVLRNLRIHARICKTTRKLNEELAVSTFQRWKCVSRGLIERKSALFVAKQYYSYRRYALALKQWSDAADKRSQARRNNSKALTRYFQQLLKASLHHWYVAARRQRRRAEYLALRQQVREGRTKTHVLRVWHIYVRWRIQRRTLRWTALQFHKRVLMRQSFEACEALLERRKMTMEREIVAATVYTEGLCCKILRAWNRVAQTSVQRRRKCCSLVRTVALKHLQTSITRWCLYCGRRQRHRQQSREAKKFYSDYLLCLAMFSWQDLWFKATTLRGKERAATKRIVYSRLANAVSWWRDFHRIRSQNRDRKAKAFELLKTRSMARYFREWRCYHEMAGHKTLQRQNARYQFEQNLLSRGFEAWRRFSGGRSFGRRKRGYAHDHRATTVFRRVFRSWKRYHGKVAMQRFALAQLHKLLLQKSWTAWKMYREHAEKMQRNILVTNQLVQHNAVRSRFTRWKAYSSLRRQRQIQFGLADDYHTMWLCKRAVTRLRRQAQLRRAIIRAGGLSLSSAMKNRVIRWKSFVARGRLKRSRRILAERTCLHNCQRRCLVLWRRLARRRVDDRTHKGDAFHRAATLTTMWTRWRRVVHWRLVVTSMRQKQLAYLQLRTWRKWRLYTQERVQNKVAARKALALQRKNLQAKALRSWQEFLGNRREKQQQLLRALRHYSVEVLQRWSFMQWKTFLVLRRTSIDNRQLAEEFNTHRLLREGFCGFKTLVGLNRKQSEETERLFRRAGALKLSRSVRKWRDRSTVCRRQHDAEALASRGYRRKFLKCVLSRLVAWRRSRVRKRVVLVKADNFNTNRLVAASFQWWQRYRAWRIKYAHLTLMFRRNRTEDIFARWKMHWEKCQLASERRLQARVFHCVRAEQRVLKTWKMTVHLQKLDKRACAFDKTKTLQKRFVHWKRRAHVIQQMRKLLLYHESCCALKHFSIWKKYVASRKQRSERLREAAKLKKTLGKARVWRRWRVWVDRKHQRRDAISLAVDFCVQFLTRKNFAAWRDRVECWKRKRKISRRGLLIYRISLLRKGFTAFASQRRTRIELTQRQEKLSSLLQKKRMQRAIDAFQCLHARHEHSRDLLRRACHHWQPSQQRKYWCYILRWHVIARHRKLQRVQAAALSRVHSLQRCVRALQAHTTKSRRRKARFEVFRRRYFRSVANNCFCQWKSFAAFKLKLRALAQTTRQSRRRQRLLHWRRVAVELARRREGMQTIAAKRRRRDLCALFFHWESVCTDLWIDKELVAHHQRYAQKHRMLISAVNKWKLQLPVRHKRLQWRRLFIKRHKSDLVRVLQRWRLASTCEKQSRTYC